MAAIMGADEYGFGSVAMIATGCVMARICHTNNCPVGVASQVMKKVIMMFLLPIVYVEQFKNCFSAERRAESSFSWSARRPCQLLLVCRRRGN